MNDRQFQQLLDQFGYSWQGYRRVRKGVIKRLVRHMTRLGVRHVEDYLTLCRIAPQIRREIRCLMGVSVSRFFRDRPLWEHIRKELIPALLPHRPEGVRVWSAGCALGQEAYSFSILWALESDQNRSMPPLLLTATDINPEYLNTAASGWFARQSVTGVPIPWRERFFQQEQDGYRIMAASRKKIRWQLHDFSTMSPPEAGFDLIFLRNNLLTYYGPTDRIAGLQNIATVLKKGGHLVIGPREKLPCATPAFRPVGNIPGLFQMERYSL